MLRELQTLSATGGSDGLAIWPGCLMRGYLRKCYLDIWMAPECEAGVRSNGWTMSGKTYTWLVFHLHGGRNPKTGQVGGLPFMMCRNAPDLWIGKRVMNE